MHTTLGFKPWVKRNLCEFRPSHLTFPSSLIISIISIIIIITIISIIIVITIIIIIITIATTITFIFTIITTAAINITIAIVLNPSLSLCLVCYTLLSYDKIQDMAQQFQLQDFHEFNKHQLGGFFKRRENEIGGHSADGRMMRYRQRQRGQRQSHRLEKKERNHK